MKWEVGPVVVPNKWDYAAAKDAAFDELRRGKVGKKEVAKLGSWEGERVRRWE